jgi:hypothetical protein
MQQIELPAHEAVILTWLVGPEELSDGPFFWSSANES